MNRDIESILFVCTGNSCRSVMAEGLMRKYLYENGMNYIKVTSAGIAALNGIEPTEETILVMKKEGIDVSFYKSKKVTAEMIKMFDLILVMEARHKEYISRIVPDASSKTFLLKEFGGNANAPYPENPNIPDPIGCPLEYYQLSLEVIKDQLKRIVEFLKSS